MTPRKPTRRAGRRPASRQTASRVEFNHAMVYTRDLDRALAFYRDALGFEVIEVYPGAYARLKSLAGRSTIALHVLEPGQAMHAGADGIRLYFEVERLKTHCAALARRGIVFHQMPKRMPWGWTHAYLRDPDGHEISLYWAGPARFRKTVMRDS